jgi:hypothetical protein
MLNDLPKEAVEKGKRTYRSITVNGEEVEFSEGFYGFAHGNVPPYFKSGMDLELMMPGKVLNSQIL